MSRLLSIRDFSNLTSLRTPEDPPCPDVPFIPENQAHHLSKFGRVKTNSPKRQTTLPPNQSNTHKDIKDPKKTVAPQKPQINTYIVQHIASQYPDATSFTFAG